MAVVDNRSNTDALQEAAFQNNLTLNVLMDVDGGHGRTGVTSSNANDLILHIASKPNLRLLGIQCYLGHIQHIQNYEGL